MPVSSKRLKAIATVFETGSFTAASKRLGVSVPSVAQMVRDLESDYSVSLFDRRGSGIVPTKLCEQLYDVAKRIVRDEEEAQQILQQHVQLEGGTLRIGLGNAMPGFAIVNAFRQLYPKIALEIAISNWSSILRDVADQKLDVAVLPNVPDDGRFRKATCLRQSIVAVARHDHVLARQSNLTCADLAEFPLIFRSVGSSTQRYVDQAFRKSNIAVDPSITLESRDGVYEAVKAGLGIGFAWEFGSTRTTDFAQIEVRELEPKVEENVFRLADNSDILAELFFQVALVEGRKVQMSKQHNVA